MMDIFGNPIEPRLIRSAYKTKDAYLRKFGDDTGTSWALRADPIPVLAGLGLKALSLETAERGDGFSIADDPLALAVGNIRMGFGHYRISMAIASAARALGRNPYWFDLHAFQSTTGGRVIARLNDLYSLGSRLSQKYPLFNRLYWERLNSEGFRRLSYNAKDQIVSQLMATPCGCLPKDLPYVATHVWPAQAAIHAGLRRVVNVVPDNWPMALHLAEGATHCVQGPSAWLGYKRLQGMAGKKTLKPMPKGSIRCVGHYIDHELVENLEADTRRRLNRLRTGDCLRILLSVGGAGAQRELFSALIQRLLPEVRAGRVCLYINVGDHAGLLDQLLRDTPGLRSAELHQDDWEASSGFAARAVDGQAGGVHIFCHADIYAAVYITNLLMRSSDLLITKPSELAFYPVPKLHIKRIGGHEAASAVRSAELGDGSMECPSLKEALACLDILLTEGDCLELMNESVLKAKAAGVYSGAYEAVRLAIGEPEHNH